MRGRLTIAFVLMSVTLMLGVLVIRFYTVGELVRSSESVDLRREAAATAELIELRTRLGEPVDELYLSTLVARDGLLTYADPNGVVLEVEGDDFAETTSEDDLVTSAPAGTGEVTLRQSDDVVSVVLRSDPGSVALLLALVALLAAFLGYFVARWVSAPFTRLANAAEQLGRGRFDLDLPRTRIREVQSISLALQTSAGQLQERLAGEQAFAEHASHVLRSPLTGLRMELEELATREDVPADARETAQRSIGRIESMDAIAGELVQLARRGSLVAGSEIPLRDLATQCAQTWADALHEQGRTLSAAVEGRLETTYTPGPVEHILDMLLPEVLRRGAGPVRMVFDADEDGHLRITVSSAAATSSSPSSADGLTLTQARTVVAALGGRLEGDHPHTGLEVLLPRR